MQDLGLWALRLLFRNSGLGFGFGFVMLMKYIQGLGLIGSTKVPGFMGFRV